MRTPQKDCMQVLNERALFPVLNNNQSSCLSRKLYFYTASLLGYLFLQILPNDFHLLLETSITSRKRVVIVTSVVSFVYKEVYGMRLSHIFEIPSISMEIPSISIKNLGS